MLDVGKPCTNTSAGAPRVPQRRLNTVTSCPSLAAVVDRQRSSVPPFCHSAKMSKLPASQRGSWFDNHVPTRPSGSGFPAVTENVGYPALPAAQRQDVHSDQRKPEVSR